MVKSLLLSLHAEYGPKAPTGEFSRMSSVCSLLLGRIREQGQFRQKLSCGHGLDGEWLQWKEQLEVADIQPCFPLLRIVPRARVRFQKRKPEF